MTIRLPKKQWEPAKPNLPKNVVIAKAKSKKVRVVSKAKAHAGEKK